ncbi:MAG: CPXCG motif-containing cysteine-rich protein [Cyanobacteria bacterium P01_C01_bin.89]
METTATFYCAFCGESILTFVDLSAGMTQSYVEDCQVCCRPNVLYLTVDEDTLEVDIQSDVES